MHTRSARDGSNRSADHAVVIAGGGPTGMMLAAELTLAQGYQWFNVVTRNTDLVGGQNTPSGPSVGIGGSTGSYGSGVGVGLGFTFGSDTRQYESVLEILMGRGPKPSDPRAYDAQQVANRAN